MTNREDQTRGVAYSPRTLREAYVANAVHQIGGDTEAYLLCEWYPGTDALHHISVYDNLPEAGQAIKLLRQANEVKQATLVPTSIASIINGSCKFNFRNMPRTQHHLLTTEEKSMAFDALLTSAPGKLCASYVAPQFYVAAISAKVYPQLEQSVLRLSI